MILVFRYDLDIFSTDIANDTCSNYNCGLVYYVVTTITTKYWPFHV